jgi:hypothetical protein
MATNNAPASPVTPTGWTPEQYVQIFKEIVTASLAFALVLLMATTTNTTLQNVGDKDRMAAAKDILLVLVGLLGVVLGYYFGRVPADARAAEAQRQATAAASNVDQISAKAEDAARRMPGSDADSEAARQELLGVVAQARKTR